MTSLCKSIASKRRVKGIKVKEGKEGKESMGFSCYRLECELLVMEGTSEAIFLYWMTLKWNLMSRSEATEGVCFQQIRYKNGTMTVNFHRLKNNPIGLNKDKACICSNPLIPAICPLRALTS